jgi:hypothetical protein
VQSRSNLLSARPRALIKRGPIKRVWSSPAPKALRKGPSSPRVHRRPQLLLRLQARLWVLKKPPLRLLHRLLLMLQPLMQRMCRLPLRPHRQPKPLRPNSPSLLRPALTLSRLKARMPPQPQLQLRRPAPHPRQLRLLCAAW